MSNVPPPPPPPAPSAPPPPPPGIPGYQPPSYQTPVYGGPGSLPPYAPEAGGYGQPPNVAGFGARLGGNLLDSLLYLLAYAPFLIAGIVLVVNSLSDCYTDINDELVCPPGALKGAPLAGGIVLLAVGLILITFFYVRALAKTGQTWGRKIVGLKVVRFDNGEVPGWGKAIGRSAFAYFISGNFCWIGYLWMLWDKNKQTLHDKVSGTRVIRV